MKRILLGSVALMALGLAGESRAADLPLEAPVLAPVSPWQFEFGTRYWYSSGGMAKDLYSNVNPAIMVSRLTFADTKAQSSELFFRGDHRPTGLFLKGFVGRGSITSGHMNDEDFAPALANYSNTLQQTHNGNLNYATIDFGWAFWDTLPASRPVITKGAVQPGEYEGLRSVGARVGVFVGFNYWNEFARTYGCSQQAGDAAAICVPSPVTTGQFSLGQDNTWRSLRLGFNGEVAMGPSWTLVVDAAFTWTKLNGFDHHQLRPDIDPLNETGTGKGAQIEGLVKYHVTDNLDLGIGARYWKNFTDGSVTFPGAATSSPERWVAQRTGVYVQASSRFDTVNTFRTAANISRAPATSIWNGFYAGFNLGWSQASSNAIFTGANGLGQMIINNGIFPSTLPVRNDGALAGGQVGYNWMWTNWVLGAEVDMGYAAIGGADSFTRRPQNLFNTTVDRNISWLGTVRGRAGYLATPSTLLYATAGWAFGETLLHVEQNEATIGGVNESGARTTSQISSGPTVGGGIEQAFNKWSSVKLEYLYVNLGDHGLGPVTLGQSQVNASIKNSLNIVRGGMNFRF